MEPENRGDRIPSYGCVQETYDRGRDAETLRYW